MEIKSNKSHLEIHLLGLLREARSVHKQHLQPYLREVGVTEDQWRVLRVLSKNSEIINSGIDAKNISRKSGIMSSSLTGVLARMERDELITRSRNENDGRFIIVKVTALGLHKAQKIAGITQDYYKALSQAMGEDEMNTLYALLNQLVKIGNQPTKKMLSLMEF